MTGSTLPSPALLQRHLHRVHYPAGRDELLNHARSECARVIHTLEMLPDREYARPTDVNKAFRDLVRVYIPDGNYPVPRDEIIGQAESAGADAAIADALRQIPDRQYESADAVLNELNDIGED
jgi:hypothetical protein